MDLICALTSKCKCQCQNLNLLLQAATLLPGSIESGDGAAVSKASAAAVEQLISQGVVINLKLDSLQQLQEMLQQHYAWELRMHQILQGDVCQDACSAEQTVEHTFYICERASVNRLTQPQSQPPRKFCLRFSRCIEELMQQHLHGERMPFEVRVHLVCTAFVCMTLQVSSVLNVGSVNGLRSGHHAELSELQPKCNPADRI